MATQPTSASQSTPNEQAKPERQPQQQEAPQSQSLLDRIISESQTEQRDRIVIRRAEFDYKQRLAKMFANSGCFQDIDKDESGAWLSEEVSIARAMVKIELGESMGFSAAESVTGIDIIKGRVAVGASLRGARMQRAGFSWPQMLVTDKGCWMPLCYKGQPMMCPKANEDGTPVVDSEGNPIMVQVVVSFGEKDAKMLGLIDKNQSMYKKDPSSMYFARTITRAQRRYGPGVLGVDTLDTYEAHDMESRGGGPAETRRVMEEFQVEGSQPGTRQAAAAVADAKIAKMEQDRQRKGFLAGETEEQRMARQEAQFAKDLEAAKANAAAKETASTPAPREEPQKPSALIRAEAFTTESPVPDAGSVPIGAECLYREGGKLRRLRTEIPQDGEVAEWMVVETVDEKPTAPVAESRPVAPRTSKPLFGRPKGDK